MVDVLVREGMTYPELELRIAWNQPMFTHHGTYIIGFSAASKHMAMAPEHATTIRLEQAMRERGTDIGKMFARQPWAKLFDHKLAAAFIDRQLGDKREVTSFWRPNEHERLAAEAVAAGEAPPVVTPRAKDDEAWLQNTLKRIQAMPEAEHTEDEQLEMR